jgi:hypothetical protein
VAITLGPDLAQNYAVLPTIGTRGGILLACSQQLFAMSQVSVRTYSVMATITNITNGAQWTVTGVCGPQDDTSKQLFLQELRQIKAIVQSRWLLMGFFNLIYRACDRSNQRVNR